MNGNRRIHRKSIITPNNPSKIPRSCVYFLCFNRAIKALKIDNHPFISALHIYTLIVLWDFSNNREDQDFYHDRKKMGKGASTTILYYRLQQLQHYSIYPSFVNTIKSLNEHELIEPYKSGQWTHYRITPKGINLLYLFDHKIRLQRLDR